MKGKQHFDSNLESTPGSPLPVRPRRLTPSQRLASFLESHRNSGHVSLTSRSENTKAVLFTHPQVILEIFSLEDNVLGRAELFRQSMNKMLGGGVLTVDNKQSAKEREVLGTVFQPSGYLEIIECARCAGRQILSHWLEAGESRVSDLYGDILQAVYMSVVDFIFGKSQEHSNSNCRASLANALTRWALYLHKINSSLPVEPLLGQRTLARIDDDISFLVDSYLHGSNNSKKQNGLSSFMEKNLLILRSTDSEESLSELEILTARLKNLLLFGNQSIAACIFWTLLSLEHYPSVAAEWRAEIHDAQSAESYLELLDSPESFTRALIHEVLRLYPPVSTMTRELLVPHCIGGEEFAAGDQIHLCQLITHRHPDFWKSPNIFMPKRFLPGAADIYGPSICGIDGAYFPFGLGSRACQASNFSILIIGSILIELAGRYEIETSDRHLKSLLCLEGDTANTCQVFEPDMLAKLPLIPGEPVSARLK